MLCQAINIGGGFTITVRMNTRVHIRQVGGRTCLWRHPQVRMLKMFQRATDPEEYTGLLAIPAVAFVALYSALHFTGHTGLDELAYLPGNFRARAASLFFACLPAAAACGPATVAHASRAWQVPRRLPLLHRGHRWPLDAVGRARARIERGASRGSRRATSLALFAGTAHRVLVSTSLIWAGGQRDGRARRLRRRLHDALHADRGLARLHAGTATAA
jgi:hypothetical protein